MITDPMIDLKFSRERALARYERGQEITEEPSSC
jgi:hypothetical protein